MRTVLTYSHKDYNLAFSAAKLLLEKTDVGRGELVLYGSAYAPPAPDEFLSDRVFYLQCEKDSIEYPLGPNAMFAYLMRYAVKKGWDEPMFMCEPDGFPTCADWHERVQKAHEETGAYASGSFVGWVEPAHFNGNMVIHPDLAKIMPALGRVVYEPWDCFWAEFFIKFGAANKEIHNPRRRLALYPTKWFFNQKREDGTVPAWIHGCQNFGAWEKIEREGFGGGA